MVFRLRLKLICVKLALFQVGNLAAFQSFLNMPPFFVYVAMDLRFSSPVSPARARDMRSHFSALSLKRVKNCLGRISQSVWQAVTAKSPSSFKSWSNRLLILASCKSSMVRLEKVWANLVKRWLSLVWEASVLASKFSISR